MARKSKTQMAEPDWPADKTLTVLQRQLAGIRNFKGQSYPSVRQVESEWAQLTRAAFIHGFGEDSHNLRSLLHAVNVGEYSVMGNSAHQLQKNFELRTEAYETVLKSSISELELMLPDAAIQGIYEAGDEYAFYRELKDLVRLAKGDVFIVDNYLSTEVFDLYVEPIQTIVSVRVLTNDLKGTLQVVAQKYAARGNFELRTSADVHDRHIFIDGRGWIVGQSIKDAARKKPTYMVELEGRHLSLARQIYEDVWATAASRVKSSS